MLYYLTEFQDVFSPLRVFQYITFRSFAAGGTSFVISLLIGPWIIRRLVLLKLGQKVRTEEIMHLFEMHGRKVGTPTMGGVMILISVLAATLLWADAGNRFVWLALATLLVMGGLGLWDDLTKIRKRNANGISARTKLMVQLVWAVVMTSLLWSDPLTRETSGHLMVPFLKTPLIEDMGYLITLIFFTLVLAGSTNGVNLTDGLDGLAAGCSNSVALAYMVMAYVAGHAIFADYLQVPYIPGAGELAVFCGALMGAGLGFLWFNCYPAEVFMGDTGSLAIGGGIAAVAIMIKQEVLLVIVGGVFFIEAVSVLIQVGYFKLSGGKRVFLCAPIHHHFELISKRKAEKAGRPVDIIETTITTRFWILSILCALVGVATLKLR